MMIFMCFTCFGYSEEWNLVKLITIDVFWQTSSLRPAIFVTTIWKNSSGWKKQFFKVFFLSSLSSLASFILRTDEFKYNNLWLIWIRKNFQRFLKMRWRNLMQRMLEKNATGVWAGFFLLFIYIACEEMYKFIQKYQISDSRWCQLLLLHLQLMSFFFHTFIWLLFFTIIDISRASTRGEREWNLNSEIYAIKTWFIQKLPFHVSSFCKNIYFNCKCNKCQSRWTKKERSEQNFCWMMKKESRSIIKTGRKDFHTCIGCTASTRFVSHFVSYFITFSE